MADQTGERARDTPPSGDEVAFVPPAPIPGRRPHPGRFATLEPLDRDRHGDELYAASHGNGAERVWDYLFTGPYPDRAAFDGYVIPNAASGDPLFFAIRDHATGRAAGVASYLNIVPAHGSIEIGHIWFGPVLQQTTAATEALFLLLRHAFDDLGYRRMEWKCNALNAASRRAAVRLGFTFEGIFYQHMVAKGRNRDTAWFSILNREWPRLRDGFDAWLDPANFDPEGRQRRSLAESFGPLR